jgi:hypothetical protein
VSSPGDTTSETQTFSRDVLRMEISGPEQEHLSVIDVPGIFKNTTPGVTTKTDMALVRDIVMGYMENPRSVMLTVVPANVDVATQEILELAADVDPNGDRTLGVLTKPDLVDRGAESKVVDLIEGRTRRTKLGWHVVRNPGQLHLASPLTRQRQRANVHVDMKAIRPIAAKEKSLSHFFPRLLCRLVFPDLAQ